jgi:hypothetical protein
MFPRSESVPLKQDAWLLEIGRQIRADYDALKEPLPTRLASLISELEQRHPTNPISSDEPEGDVH